MNLLVRCINCDEITLKTPFDQCPEYDTNGSFESFKTLEKDDFKDFLQNHHGHRLEDLKILEDSFISEKDYAEPVKTSYFKATNGRESFVVKKYREKIDDPLKYQLIYGDYSLTCVGIEIQSKEIVNQLNAEFKKYPLHQNQIDAFLKLLHFVLKNINIKKLERIPEESPNASEIYYKMDDITLAYLLRNCHNIFKGEEYTLIQDFIHRHKEDGVLLIKANYKIQITEMVPSRKKAMSAQIHSEKRRVVTKG